jgi:hypothetical protein
MRSKASAFWWPPHRHAVPSRAALIPESAAGESAEYNYPRHAGATYFLARVGNQFQPGSGPLLPMQVVQPAAARLGLVADRER